MALPEPTPDAREHSERVAAHVREEIAASGGWISFARYMELALYAPGLGYYSAGSRKLGRAGDFVTAPEISPLYGQTLARQVKQVLDSGFDEVLEVVDLTAAAGKRVRAYSQGMRQRLGIAAALLGDPDVLVLDEPTNGLDPQGMREIRLLLRRLADAGTTVFVSSHLLAEVEAMCDRVGVLAHGKLLVVFSSRNNPNRSCR